MSTALRRPEFDTQASASSATASPQVASPTTGTSIPAESLDWREVSPYVETFTGAPSESEGIERRSKLKSHRKFFVSGAFCAGALVFAQLLGLVYLYSLDLKMTRQAAKLDEQVRQTRLQISLTEMKLASAKSSPKLSTWAAQLGYREATLGEMDDVTSRSPMPSAPTSQE